MRDSGIVILGYLLGSILFGKLFLRLLKQKDIGKEEMTGIRAPLMHLRAEVRYAVF